MLNQILYKDIASSSGTSGDDAPHFPGDIFPGSEDENDVSDEVLHARSGKIIYKDGFSIPLWTWWDFDQTSENKNPYAYINGEVKCWGHATSHIIDYLVTRKDFSGRGSIMTMYVNMKMGSNGSESCKWNGSASCTHRLWGGSSSYYSAETRHRAEKSGTCGGGATFKVTYDIDKDDYWIT